MFFFRLLASLPLSILYVLSDLLYMVVYHLLQYRRDVVKKNLLIAFPEKSDKERKALEREFYRRFTDVFIEILRSLKIPSDELTRRMKIDLSRFEELKQQGKSIVVMTGHLCNWDVALNTLCARTNLPFHAVFQKLKNPFFGRLMLEIRSRYGAVLHESGDLVRALLQDREQQKVFGTVADQRPVPGENRYWTTFMNAETGFYTGTEKIARKLGYTVLYLHIRRPKRGYYQAELIDIAAPPFDDPQQYSITERYVRLLEENIRQEPAGYLWSHNRWKHRPPASTAAR